MAAKVSALMGAMFSGLLMITALWAWQASSHLTIDAARPDVATMAVKTAAVAAAAAAQAVLLIVVLAGFYRRGRLDTLLGVLAGVVGVLALASAIALGLAGH